MSFARVTTCAAQLDSDAFALTSRRERHTIGSGDTQPRLPNSEVRRGHLQPRFSGMSGNANLDGIFNPTSVAIAGVAVDGIGRAFLDCLLDSGFKGKVYPLNPKGGEIRGLRVHPSIKDVPGPVDYVLSCIPARLAPQLIKDSAAKGVKVVSFFTAGFSEMATEEGRTLEQEMVRVARDAGVRILGPNCLGVYRPELGLSFASDFPRERGRVAFICQSGGNAIYLIRSAVHRGIRFSKAVSYGNACDIDESELLEYFAGDNETEIVAAYIEGVRHGPRFYEALRRVAAVKPVIVLKAGGTDAGVRAAASHTGALAGSDTIWDRALRQVGAIRAYDLEELVDTLVAFCHLPRFRGRRVALCGAGGGHNVIATDKFGAAGFVLPPLPGQIQEEMRKGIRKVLNTEAGFMFSNPVDVTNMPFAEGLHDILKTLATYDGIDLLVGQFSINNSGWPYEASGFSGWPESFTEAAISVRDETNRPVALIAHAIVSEWDFQKALALQRRCCEAGLPAFRSAARAATAIDRFLRYHQKKSAARADR
jgi:acyl-CoA synthetase (NDP forming)